MPQTAGWIYRCWVCGATRRVDFAYRALRRSAPLDGRDPEVVAVIYSHAGEEARTPKLEWAPVCCDLPMKGQHLRAETGKNKPCGPACLEAVGPTCSCACGGINHGAAHRI